MQDTSLDLRTTAAVESLLSLSGSCGGSAASGGPSTTAAPPKLEYASYWRPPSPAPSTSSERSVLGVGGSAGSPQANGALSSPTRGTEVLSPPPAPPRASHTPLFYPPPPPQQRPFLSNSGFLDGGSLYPTTPAPPPIVSRSFSSISLAGI